MKAYYFLLVLAIFFSSGSWAQPAPFYEDIQDFKKRDSLKFPPKNAILFVGSSSFTKWVDVAAYFPAKTIINRGFGGSSLTDVIRYADDIIFPYQPKQVVIYCGENDLATADTVSVQTVVHRFKILFAAIRKKMPQATITFVSLKPSPSRLHLMSKMQAVNKEVKSFLATKKSTSYVNVYDKMLLPNGRPLPQIFVADSLHMNAKGYAIWQKAITPYLKN